MTNPFAVTPGPAIFDPSMSPTAGLVSGLAQVLAQQQQQREMQMRLQQLALQQQQQQALAAYYQGTLSLQSREQGRIEGELTRKRAAEAQAGGAVQRALGVGGSPVQTAVQQTQAAGGMVGDMTAPGVGVPLPMPSGTTVDPRQQQLQAGQSPLQAAIEGGAQAIGGPAGLSQIFQGVAPENMDDAIAGLQAAQALQPKQPELPTSAQEFQFASFLKTVDPSGRLWNEYITNWINKPQAPGATVNVNLGDDSFSKKRGELQAQGLADSETAAKNAVAQFGTIDEAYKVSRKALTGLGAGAVLNLNRALSALGVQPSKDRVADTQTFQKLTGELALGYLRSRDLGSGTAVSDQDREFMLALAAGNINLDGAAIRRTLRINYGAGIMKVLDAVQELRALAMTREKDAPDLLKRANELEGKAQNQWLRYAQMLAEEGMTTQEIRTKLLLGGITDPEPYLKNLPKPDVKGTADAIFGPRR